MPLTRLARGGKTPNGRSSPSAASRRSVSPGMLLFVLTLTAIASASAQTARMIEVEGEARKYWSSWRGPSGQGIVEGRGYPDTWSDTENVRWKVNVPGRGHSSPTVWKDRIFLTTAYDGAR